MVLHLPKLGNPSTLQFVLERFLVDFQLTMQHALGKRRLVASYTTHTDYFDDERKRFVCDPPILSKGAAATVPAVGFSGLTITRNSNAFKNDFQFLSVDFENEAGEMVTGLKQTSPVEVIDIGIAVRIFDDRPQDLVNLQQLFFRYFDTHPYLFIPLDYTNREGVQDQCRLDDLKEEWFTIPYTGLSIPGFFVKQMIPIGQTVFTSTLRASIDNLFVAGSTILLEEIPLSDGVDFGNLELIENVGLDLCVEDGDSFEDTEDEVCFPIDIT